MVNKQVSEFLKNETLVSTMGEQKMATIEDGTGTLSMTQEWVVWSIDPYRMRRMTEEWRFQLSHFSRVRLCDPTDDYAARQAPPSLGFSRQEHWSGVPFPSPMHESEKSKWSRLVVSDPQRPHGLQPIRLLHPWDFPGKSTGVGCHCLQRSW